MMLIPVLGIDIAYATSDEEVGDTGGAGGDNGGGDNIKSCFLSWQKKGVYPLRLA